MGENFKLKWNDHHSIFFSTAEALCQGDHLTDVTLSCGKREFSAHKLVLSICSTYFNELFTPKQKNRPANGAAIVYLKDVNPYHMEHLLNFMYRGEINIEEDELMDLLNTARGLQIRGLSDSVDESESDLIKPEQQAKHHVKNSNSSKAVKRVKTPVPSTSSAAVASSSAPPPKKIKEEASVVVAEPHVEEYDVEDPGDGLQEEYVEGQEEEYGDTGDGSDMMYDGGDLPAPEVGALFLIFSIAVKKYTKIFTAMAKFQSWKKA